MRVPTAWGIAGSPVRHSVTPMLFDIIGRELGMMQPSRLKIEVDSVDKLNEHLSSVEGDIWLSCTSPLKSSLFKLYGDQHDTSQSINQIVRREGKMTFGNTDGLGFLEACKSEGIIPRGKTMKMRGGGATARSIAIEWVRMGGSIVPVRGRRQLPDGPWSGIKNQDIEADIALDLDVTPGQRGHTDLRAKKTLSISYGTDWNPDDFAIKMVCSQHIVAWKTLYTPEKADKIPSLEDLIVLLSRENRTDNHS